MATSGRSWDWFKVAGVAIGFAIAVFGDCASAQITPDGTLPNNSIVTPQGTKRVISGGTQAGSNLFHSFEEFSVPTGGAAHFNNALDIQNIISRVTGGSVSNIDGLIRANGSANLFLLNPNGIIFGPNASLNIGGSFLGSTASSLNFADGTQFSATAPQTTPLLTVSVPIGLQYGMTPQSIRNQSRATNSSGQVVGLQVQPNKTLAFVGGDVKLDGGKLFVPGGEVELGGVAGAGTIGLNFDGDNLGLSFPDGIQRADVSLTNGAGVDVTSGGGGSIAINAQNLDVLGGSFLYAGIGADLGSVDTQAGDITLNATGEITLGQSSRIENNVNSNAAGNAGNITINAGTLSLTDGAQVSNSTFGQGDAGSVSVQVNDSVSLANSDIFSSVEERAVGNGGGINITTGSLEVTNGAELLAYTNGRGDAGSVNINARDTVSFDGVGGGASGAYSTVDPGAVGNGGGINITTGSLVVTNSAQLVVSVYGFGEGNAGSVNINARDTVSFDGVSSDGYPSGAFSTVQEGAVGDGGNINVTAGSLSLTDGATLSASTYGQGDAGSVFVQANDSVSLANGRIFSTVANTGVGNAGNINVTARSLSLTEGAALNTSTNGQGNAGIVTITASDTISIDGVSSDGYVSRAASTVEEEAVGNGGGINITTGSLALTNGAELLTYTNGRGDAGSVNINARDTVSFDGVSSDEYPSGAFSTVQEGAVGDGGNINVTAGSLYLTDGAYLEATTTGQGNAGSVTINARDNVSLDYSPLLSRVDKNAEGRGGNINITTGSLSLTNGAQLDASTFGQGNAGNIIINARDTVSLDGISPDGQFKSVIFSEVVEGAQGNGGKIEITTGSLSVTNGAALNNRTLGRGNAGSIIVRARDTVSFDGVDSDGLPSAAYSTVGPGAVGNGGGINITTGLLSLTNGAGLTASSEGSGAAGNIEVAARSIRLQNQAFINSDTTAGQGNIFLDSQDLMLRRESNITTDATGRSAGGNITIDTDIIAALENSDISANAEQALGGQVRISAQGIFGTEFRERGNLATSDITATSDLGLEFSGTVEINTPDVDPSRGLAALPTALVDAPGLIATGCSALGENEFIITGRGGLPPSPSDPLRAEAVLTNWATLGERAGGAGEAGEQGSRGAGEQGGNQKQFSRLPRTSPYPPIPLSPHPLVSPSPHLPISPASPTLIVEAQGWVINDKGEVVLTANAPNATPHNPWLPSTTCHTSQNSS